MRFNQQLAATTDTRNWPLAGALSVALGAFSSGACSAVEPNGQGGSGGSVVSGGGSSPVSTASGFSSGGGSGRGSDSVSAQSGGGTGTIRGRGGETGAPMGGSGSSSGSSSTMGGSGSSAGGLSTMGGSGSSAGGSSSSGLMSRGGAASNTTIISVGGGGGRGSGVPALGGGGVSATGGTSAVSGASGMMDHCMHGFDPLPSDGTMQDGPSLFFPPGKEGDMSIVDTTLQPEVLKWMTENAWQGAHVEWHAIRGCKSGIGAAASHVNICRFTSLIPQDQNCATAGDGYQFLLFHRHMIESLKQLWPKHKADFEGFPKFPQTPEELPEAWRASWKAWANDTNGQQILAAAKIADEIDKPENLQKFANEGEVGYWLQCNVGTRALTNSMPWVGLHFVLHDKWTRAQNRTHGLNNTEVNIENYMFWKLHGWIDNVWEKYRVAKGITADPTKMAKYKDDLYAQCDEMDKEIRIIKENLTPADPLDPVPTDETGFFHEQVRPIFESETARCVSCHADVGGQLGVPMILGGNISSKKIVEGLLKDSAHAPGFKLVVPGQPDKSWLYRKVSGTAATAGCVVQNSQNTNECNLARMPPTGKVSDAELEIIRKWIADGAQPPP